MPRTPLTVRKQLRRPAGCEGYLTRRQAAAVLGFASEFKVREFEHQGLLRSVRGPMRAAFYPRAEILALKAKLAQHEPHRATPDDWSDADLILLLEHPRSDGRLRTALDLVMETRISIERAERVHGFWSAPGKASAASAPRPPRFALSPNAPHPPLSARPPLPVERGEAGPGERRGEDRLTRDSLIRELRDPDPRVRQEAFERLRENRASDGG
jgi:hypothetical protein